MSATAAAAAASASCDICGWTAAFCSALAFGSFGVPIKSGAATQVDIDPLVMQTYKSAMVFVTSWFVLAAGESFHFTPWGIVSGLFWVPGGVATVYAIKAAGLAIGIGIGSSFIVLVSFVWGIFVFDEQIHSHFWACFAIFLMVLGLFGMSYYSSPSVGGGGTTGTTTRHHEDMSGMGADGILSPTGSSVVYHLQTHSQDEDDGNAAVVTDAATNQEDGLMMTNAELAAMKQQSSIVLTDRTSRTTYSDSVAGAGAAADTSDLEDGGDTESLHPHGDGGSVSISNTSIQSHHVVMCGGVVITKRRLGMLAAMFCGIWGGSIMAPMKYSPPDTKGVGFLISFAIGASIVTSFLWLLRFLYYWKTYESPVAAYQNLPSFHFRKMWCAGATCGLLWSVGNFFSLFSVYYLGEGVGYPLVQTSILISGLWGIFYYKEVRGFDKISKWLLSSMLTIAGIILLSYEHHEK